MAEGDGTRDKDWTIEEQVPMLAMPFWEAAAQKNTCNTSAGLRKASKEEAPARGIGCFVSFAVCVNAQCHAYIVWTCIR